MHRMIGRRFILFLMFLPVPVLGAAEVSPTSRPSAAPSGNEDPSSAEKFEEKLAEMLARTEKSIKLVREQIVESSTAPFLPELYLQLAELLSQKSNTLYYVQMERQKKANTMVAGDKAFSPVVIAQQEAIAVYQTIIKDFPKFLKRGQVLFRLALAQKSIDDIIPFIKTSSEVLSQYPNSEEAVRISLLLGQHYFDGQNYDRAMELLKPLVGVKMPYERNLAKYRIGLIHIAGEKFRDALSQFEQVIMDPELKEQDNPYSISLKTRSAKMDLKREALIDSIRAYTYVYVKDPDPVSYYSKLAPTEIHFQEVVEKLALRYINLKKYDHAIKLLRTLSERTADPQKVVNIYQEVLLMIPIKDRIDVPIEEMRFVLEKYNLWFSFFDVPKPALNQSYGFFEKQIRDLGTTSHDFAKRERDPKKKTHYLQRAREFYLLYLGFFDRTSYAGRMATNLADVYFALSDYLRSGDYYLRVYSGEFGKPANSKLLIENAILCLQKKGEFGFYENVRMRGLLIKSIESYTKADPSQRKNADLNFSLLKAEYEQGFFPEILEKLYGYMKQFRGSPHAVDSGEMILDYFNTRNEFGALEHWSGRILSLKLPDAIFNRKVAQIQKQARGKAVQEKVKSISGYDDFAQGKSYLAAALASDDGGLAQEALKQALAKSKREKDIQTFLEAASVMANKERDRKKRADILRSVGREYIRITRYYDGLNVFNRIMADSQYATSDKTALLEECISTALVLRDWDLLEKYLSNPLWIGVSTATRTRLREQLTDLVDSGMPLSRHLTTILTGLGMTDETMLVLFKAQYRLDGGVRDRVLREIRGRCGSESRQSVCKWGRLEVVDGKKAAFRTTLSRAPLTLQGIESVAPSFMALTTQLQSLEGSGDALLETMVSLKSYEAYRMFAEYLNKAANSNADFRTVLQQKAQETMASARLYLDKCRIIGERSAVIGSSTKFCKAAEAPTLDELLEQSSGSAARAPASESSSGPVEDLRKNIFSNKEDAASMLGLAKLYYNDGYFHHSAAAASYGTSLFKQQEGDFRAILGCSVMKLGLVREATYHIKSASSADGLKEQCQAALNSMRGRQ